MKRTPLFLAAMLAVALLLLAWRYDVTFERSPYTVIVEIESTDMLRKFYLTIAPPSWEIPFVRSFHIDKREIREWSERLNQQSVDLNETLHYQTIH